MLSECSLSKYPYVTRLPSLKVDTDLTVVPFALTRPPSVAVGAEEAALVVVVVDTMLLAAVDMVEAEDHTVSLYYRSVGAQY